MPQRGHFILHSNVVPSVVAGKYELVSEHTIDGFDVEPERTHVHVASPRYTMPTDQILSSFPPANAEGAFGDRLPQIVLKRRTLPWERNPAGVKAPSEKPWLALVVVAEGEAELSTATPVGDCVTAGTLLLEPDDRDVEQGLYLGVTETVVKKIFPCEQDLALLTHVREVDVNDTELANGDDDGWLAVVLANRLPVFDKANEKPVRYMACLVNVEGQLAALPPLVPPVQTFEFALAQDFSALAQLDLGGGADVLVTGTAAVGDLVLPMEGSPGAAPAAAGHRVGVPAAARAKGAVHGAAVGASLDGAAGMTARPTAKDWSSATGQVSAVALDPDAKVLVRDRMGVGFRLPIGRYALEKVLRFPVLAHWSFTTTEGATFETLMQDIDVGLLGSVDPPAPDTPAGDTHPEVVPTGHIGLGHRTRAGDKVRAWYRGACVPLPTPRDGASKDEPLALAHSADQLRRVIPDGREDLSLAAAFEIGRLLALSQLSVVSALLRFRSEQFGAGRVREVLAEILTFELPALVDDRIDFGRFAALNMLGEMVRDPDKMLGPRRPVADPGRALDVRGDLDALVARGLGLDLANLRKREAAVGALQALGELSAPVALALGEQADDKLIVPALRAALRTELGRTLAVAEPVVFGGIGLTRAREAPMFDRRGSAGPAPDALDRLIAGARDDDARDEPVTDDTDDDRETP
jgi:hypothetical protein